MRDERLSEYLDGFLSRPDAVALEASAEHDSETRLALEGMRAVRANLGELGMVRAPRSFMLTPQTAPRQRGLPRIELYARLATAAAVVALTATTLQPSFTGTNDERATTSMSESSDSAAPDLARKQGAEQAPQAMPATAAAEARSAAPTSQGAPGAGAGPQAPEPSGALAATPAVERSPFEAFATAPATPVPALPPPSEQPLPLSDGVADSGASGLETAQFGLALLASGMAALSLLLWLRRARGN